MYESLPPDKFASPKFYHRNLRSESYVSIHDLADMSLRAAQNVRYLAKRKNLR